LNSRAEPGGGQHRVFIGIGCDETALKKIRPVTDTLRERLSGIIWVPASNHHLTLAFLGSLNADQVEKLIAAMKDAYRNEQCFTYQLTGLCRFPQPDSGIIALTGDAGTRLLRLYEQTLSLLLDQGLEPAWPDFKPHVTLGRSRRPMGSAIRIDRPVSISLEVRKISLYKSTLAPAGSIYTVLHEVHLQEPGA
jgi:2'-5' RNA ligase